MDSYSIFTPELLLLAALLGLIPAVIANRKGHNFVGWWAFGFLLFIIALPLAILAKPDRSTLEARQIAAGDRKCPYCAELIKREASVCRFCGRESEAWSLYQGHWWVKRPDGDFWLDEPRNVWVKVEPSEQPTGPTPSP